MKTVGVLLLLQLGAAAALMVTAVVVSSSSQTPTPIDASATDGGVEASDAGVDQWIPLEKLEYMKGAWETENHQLLVTVMSMSDVRPLPEPGEFWVQPWRLVLGTEAGPAFTCGVYEGVQYSPAPGSIPWRLGYCKNHDGTGGDTARVTRLSILRWPGFEGLRLIYGNDLDMLIYQVP